MTRRDQRSQKHESGDRYIPEPKFPVQPSSMTIEHAFRGDFAGGDVEAPSVRISPAPVIRPTISTEAGCVIDENDPKNTPNGNLTSLSEIKTNGTKISERNTRNPSKHNHNTAHRHDVASVCKGTIRKWPRNICRVSHGINRRRALGLSQSNNRPDVFLEQYAPARARSPFDNARPW